LFRSKRHLIKPYVSIIKKSPDRAGNTPTSAIGGREWVKLKFPRWSVKHHLWFPRSRVGTLAGTLLRLEPPNGSGCIPTRERGNEKTVSLFL
jgi:hypothetical protein